MSIDVNMINVNERHIMPARQNLLLLSLLIRYVQHQMAIGNL